MTAEEVMKELETMGSPSIKKVLMAHGAKEPFFGVKVEDLKKIQKKVKKDYNLSLSLYQTGNSDAMYLAGLIADETKMTRQDLETWLSGAYWSYLSEYTVPWVASETPFGWELGVKWIESDDEKTAAAGWCTLAGWLSLKPDSELDLPAIRTLISRIQTSLHQSPNRVKYCMNGFLISAGAYVADLTSVASEAGTALGKVQVDMNGTACKVPYSPEYIQKAVARGTLSRKKKTCRC